MAENDETSGVPEETKSPKRLTKEQIIEKANREVFLRLLQIHKQKKKS